MKTHAIVISMILSVSGCALMKPAMSFYSETKSAKEIEIDFLRCKQENSGANLTEAEQLVLAKECMVTKGYEILPTEEAERRDRQKVRR